jgi:hypothetical protein
VPDRAALVAAFEAQAQACAAAGSPLYGALLNGAAADLAAGGAVADVVADDDEEPYTSALALRFMGAVHRLVLEGRAPELAARYPTVGGVPERSDPVPLLLATVAEHRAELRQRLPAGVQTNEVGRSAVLVGGYARVAARCGLPLRLLEIGASAGLNLRFDHYHYDTGPGRFGDPTSPVRFQGVWEGDPPDLSAPLQVAERRGCDRCPVDPTTEEGRITLLSYVWADQADRVARLEAAIEVARRVPASIERSDAAPWLEAHLAVPAPGTATVVAHTIVVQYLTPQGRRRVLAAIEAAGAGAHDGAPVAWLRMEPAGERAELRLTTWPGGHEELMASAGYHGRPIRWLA